MWLIQLAVLLPHTRVPRPSSTRLTPEMPCQIEHLHSKISTRYRHLRMSPSVSQIKERLNIQLLDTIWTLNTAKCSWMSWDWIDIHVFDNSLNAPLSPVPRPVSRWENPSMVSCHMCLLGHVQEHVGNKVTCAIPEETLCSTEFWSLAGYRPVYSSLVLWGLASNYRQLMAPGLLK